MIAILSNLYCGFLLVNAKLLFFQYNDLNILDSISTRLCPGLHEQNFKNKFYQSKIKLRPLISKNFVDLMK